MNNILKSIIIAALISLFIFGAFLFTGIGVLLFVIIAVMVFVVFFFLSLIKNIIKIGIIVGLIAILLFYFNNTYSEKNKALCNTDNDCVCDGIDIKTGNCFVGNKNYYNLYVNKKAYCPDFCTGIANNLETKCINNKCLTTSKNQTK